MRERPELLRSEVLAHVPHAFSTRRGGVSRGVFESLNFGNPMDLPPERKDAPANLSENFRRVLTDIGVPARAIMQVYQVHGGRTHVFRARSAARDHTPEGERDFRADAMVSDDPARMLAVRVADCAPILAASGDGRVVAAIHSGWRGVIEGVVRSALESMRAMGGTQIRAALGPCIGAEAFEVGAEVVSAFRTAFGSQAESLGIVREHPNAQARAAGKGLVDLQAALRVQLQHGGVEAVDVLCACTYTDSERFFSHRRDAGITGRMIGIIGPA